jgi:LuxR family quorum sensing-dependent transcriptional regulator
MVGSRSGAVAAPPTQTYAEFSARLLHYTNIVESLETPEKVLNALDEVTVGTCKIRPLGALLLPLRWGDLSGFELGKTVFLHGSAPKGWWEEQHDMMRQSPGPGEILARLALAPFTMSETMASLDPLGVDRWPFELALKYGMRDRLSCPVGGRWLVVYWSRCVLSGLTPEQRALLFLGATFAAIRLQRLASPSINRLGKSSSLTPRELAVLRLMASGKRMREIAQLLGLGEETVRSHLKKAQVKLGVRERTHAVAQAIRLHLIA